MMGPRTAEQRGEREGDSRAEGGRKDGGTQHVRQHDEAEVGCEDAGAALGVRRVGAKMCSRVGTRTAERGAVGARTLRG